MIISKIQGGLGNQMFQYAVGRALAFKNETKLKLDITFLHEKRENTTFRSYNLDCFKFEAGIASSKDISQFFPDTPLQKIYNRFFPHRLIKEKDFRFDRSILLQTGNLYLEGYWQSEKYFEDITAILRKDFEFKEPISSPVQKSLEGFTNTILISLHIRRGDYITDKKTNQYHGVCDISYYQNAISFILERVEKAHFLIFSDEVEWVKKNFHIPAPLTVIEGYPPHEDLRLMSLCHHHILANSTFSWWGAWLNPSAYKMVIAPKNWFANPLIDDTDLIPSNWIRL